MTAGASREQLIDATRDHLRQRGHAEADIHTLFVPGRVEVFGKHTDYCGGRSLLIATSMGLYFSVAPRADKTVSLHTLGSNKTTEFELSTELIPTLGDWSNYPATVARRVSRNFDFARTGCDIALSSNLPPAAGISSSSALIIGTFLCLDRVNGIRESPLFRSEIRSREELSAYLGSIENGSSYRSFAGDRGVGTTGGSQDHTAILCCQADMLSRFAFCPVRHEQSIPIGRELCFAIGVSGVVADKTGNALHRYNAVSESARKIVELYNRRTGDRARCLADILHLSPAAIDTADEWIGSDATLRARFEQFHQESEKLIPAAAKAFAAGDWTTFGHAADHSQQLAERCLGNQIPETIALQHSARECGALAASAFGAGFGGSVWALIDAEGSAAFLRRWSTASPGQFHLTRASDGAHWLTI